MFIALPKRQFLVSDIVEGLPKSALPLDTHLASFPLDLVKKSGDDTWLGAAYSDQPLSL
jgi:hypothetical protein